jgi:parvulin-like peptidyl-prolyl isomerase
VIALGAAVVAAVVVIAIFGYYQTQIRPEGETVLKVGDRSFSLDYFERRLRYDIREGNTIYEANPSQATTLLLNEIETEELMRQGAPEKGVDLSEEAIDAEIRSQENVPANADRNAFAAYYREAVRSSGLTTEGYRDVIAAGIAQNAIQLMFQEQAPKTADQVRFRVIVLSTEDEAQAALDRLRNGEDFATVASELSQHEASRQKGGEQDWTPRGVLESALDEALFSLEVGQISDIITGQSALFIVQVLERQDQRETTDSQQSLLASQAQHEWLSQLRDRVGVATSLNDDQRNSILEVLQSEVQRGQ